MEVAVKEIVSDDCIQYTIGAIYMTLYLWIFTPPFLTRLVHIGGL